MEYLKQIYSDGAATMGGTDDIRFGIGKKKAVEAKASLGELADRVLGFKDNFMIDGKLSSALVSEKFNVGRHRALAVISIVKERWKKVGGVPI
jgi:hypothetical protein